MAAGSPPARPAPRRLIAGLDGIRATAAGLVLVFHYWALTGRQPLPEPLLMIAMNGGLGVDIFFVISGFILFLPWARAAWTGARVEVRRFLTNRFLRIVPAYWLNAAVLVVVAFPALLFDADGWRSLVLYGSFLAGFAPPSQVAHLMLNPVAWTLCIEVAFYLALPVVARLFVRDRWMIAFPLCLGLTIAFKALMVARYGHLENTVVISVATRNIVAMFGEFAVGMVVAAIWAKLEHRRVLRLPAGLGPACVLAGFAGIVATLYLNQYSIGRDGFLRGSGELGWWPMLALFQVLAVFSGLVLFGICYQANGITRMLSLRPIAYLGTVSYGIYLWHYPIGQWLAEGVGAEMNSRRMLVSLLLAGTAATIAVAAFSYRFVEQPFLRRKAPPLAPTVPPPPRHLSAAPHRPDRAPGLAQPVGRAMSDA